MKELIFPGDDMLTILQGFFNPEKYYIRNRTASCVQFI